VKPKYEACMSRKETEISEIEKILINLQSLHNSKFNNRLRFLIKSDELDDHVINKFMLIPSIKK
jgi:hypothetical protein